jgi:hypothetical protein
MVSSPSIIRIITSRKMGWAVRVARIEAKKNIYTLLGGKLEWRRPRHDGKVILKRDLKEIVLDVWTG